MNDQRQLQQAYAAWVAAREASAAKDDSEPTSKDVDPEPVAATS